MAEEKVIDIGELAQDTHNFNRGNEQGQQLMERSFKELGAGRSILLDRNGNIIAGNKSQKAAIAAGIKRVRVIETTGDELVAVKRTDVDIDTAEGRKMAYLDNLTTQVNLTWDVRAPFTQGGGLRRGCGVKNDQLPDLSKLLPDFSDLLPDFSDLLPDLIEPLEANPQRSFNS